MYPPDLRESDNKASFGKALSTLGVDQWTAGDIISIFLKTVGDDVAVGLTNMRNRFYSWQTGRRLYNRKWLQEVQYLGFWAKIIQLIGTSSRVELTQHC